MLSGRRPDLPGHLAHAPTAVLVIAVTLVASSAHADCEAEASLSIGVTVQRCTEEGRRWSVVHADLAASDVGVRIARSGERGQTASAWRASVPGAVVAVQGGAFRFPGWDPEGLTIAEGEVWPGSADDGTRAVLALDAEGAGLVVPAVQTAPAESWMRSVVSGVEVVRAGAPITGCEGGGCERRPRTAVGISGDGRTLVIVVVEGWTATSEGVSDPELGALTSEAGAHDAIRIGEGATSALTTAGAVAEIPSSDGALRAAGPFLGIVNRAAGATGLLRSVMELPDHTRLPGGTYRVESTDGRLVAMPRANASAYWQLDIAARTYIVHASLAGYRDECKVCTVPPGYEEWCSFQMTPGSGTAECAAPPRGIDAGVYPIVDAGGIDATAEVDGGSTSRGIGGGCSVSAGARTDWRAAAILAMLATVGAWMRRGRRA
ncbi:phosphodiester glycosidase family protein [Sandaracinus amylolyticus]|uniref:phosphodiester glycosidase family protein n=1 Tax=Sandaracinus amylolyticus TaxID=927083 RepID=UPI001F23388E|nr:phosphodiester glycosidase family protein [Sandaracinus amylolyticus]UJR79767.1 NAGPA domain-containing protein [Sandaracinus amylolyticus]